MDRTYCGRAQDAAPAVEILNRLADAMQPTYAFSLRIAPVDLEAAEAIGKARQVLAEAGGFRDGGNRESGQRAHTIGALGELLLGRLLAKAGVEFTPLVAAAPRAEPDFVLAKSFDIKTVKRGSNRVAINYAAHRKEKAAAYAIVIHRDEETADVYVISASAVSAWPTATARSTYYFYNLPEPTHA